MRKFYKQLAQLLPVDGAHSISKSKPPKRATRFARKWRSCASASCKNGAIGHAIK